MASKQVQTKKKAAGGKRTATKPSAAPAKKPTTRKAAAAPVRAATTRTQPGRRARGDGDNDAANQKRAPPSPPRIKRKPAKKAIAPAEDGDVDDVLNPASRKTRTRKRPTTDDADDAGGSPPAKCRKQGRGRKAPAPSDDEDDEDVAPAPSRGSRAAKRPAADDTDSSDDVPLAEKRARRGEGQRVPAAGPASAPAPDTTAAAGDEDENQDQDDEQQDDEQQNDEQQEEELIDDVRNNPDISVALNNPIAQAELPNVNFTSRTDNTDVTLRFVLEVHTDPWRTSSRLFYRLRFFLTRTDEKEQDAGYIHSHRIAKRTAAHPNADNRAWMNELLNRNPEDMDDGSVKENILCLRAFFTPTGNPNGNKIRNANLRNRIRDEALMFIEMIHIRIPFQRRGLLLPLLENWQSLLQRLPEWSAFRGNVVLVPGMPDSDVGRRVWWDTDEADVEQILTRVYERVGFVVWVRNAKVGENVIRVMGKGVGVEVGAAGGNGEGEGDGTGADTKGPPDRPTQPSAPKIDRYASETSIRLHSMTLPRRPGRWTGMLRVRVLRRG